MSIFRNINILLCLFLTAACTTTQSFYVDVDRVDNFELLNYDSFQITAQKDNLSPEINPIVVDSIKNDLQNELILRGMSVNTDAPIVMEISFATKEEIDSNYSYFNSRYYRSYYGYPFYDDIESKPTFLFRLTVKDAATGNALWTGFTSYNQYRLDDSGDVEARSALINSLLNRL